MKLKAFLLCKELIHNCSEVPVEKLFHFGLKSWKPHPKWPSSSSLCVSAVCAESGAVYLQREGVQSGSLPERPRTQLPHLPQPGWLWWETCVCVCVCLQGHTHISSVYYDVWKHIRSVLPSKTYQKLSSASCFFSMMQKEESLTLNLHLQRFCNVIQTLWPIKVKWESWKQNIVRSRIFWMCSCFLLVLYYISEVNTVLCDTLHFCDSFCIETNQFDLEIN